MIVGRLLTPVFAQHVLQDHWAAMLLQQIAKGLGVRGGFYILDMNNVSHPVDDPRIVVLVIDDLRDVSAFDQEVMCA